MQVLGDMVIRIGTRGSKLALAQSRWVKQRIEETHPHVRVELVRIRTKGDKILDSPLSKIGGKGLFTKEIEEALLKKLVDVAVHSMKDVPAELPESLTLSMFPEREDPRDALISKKNLTLEQLPRGSRIGTGSLRRAAQLLHIRPDLDLVALRGNVDTRIGKLESGDVQAIVLAAAGLNRLGFASRITQIFSADQMLPAIGQGALALEVRCDDDQTISLLGCMNHEPTEIAIRAERAVLRELEGGCQVPIGAFAHLDGEELYVQGMVADLDGTELVRKEITGEKHRPEETGVELARQLLNSGADKILARIYGKE